jgi:hypothetical protein
LAVDWFKMRWGKWESWRRAQINQWSQAAMVSGDGEKPPVHRRQFFPPGRGRAYPTTAAPTTAATDAVNWLGN